MRPFLPNGFQAIEPDAKRPAVYGVNDSQRFQWFGGEFCEVESRRPVGSRLVDGKVLSVSTALKFFSVKNWQQIRFGLQRCNDLRDLEVVSRSACTAEAVFDFDGCAGQVQRLLAQKDIALYQRDGRLVMRASNPCRLLAGGSDGGPANSAAERVQSDSLRA